ncbi:MAG TPA: glucose-6-phosphate dehydrogenase [Gemmatimonadaceae bacterium]|nr:glucose-6-phosphate dehydrogenase [Gemmatimonadaceae bacterium]
MAAAPEPVVFVVFGATGDLARRKIFPALAALAAEGPLDPRSAVLGVARDARVDDAALRRLVRESVGEGGGASWSERSVFFQTIAGGTPADFEALAGRIAALERDRGMSGHRIFYVALPPAGFAPTIEGLGGAGLHRSAGSTRLVIEKPFGRDLESARALNGVIHHWFDESQVYRIDHYLGKETVQNLLVFRFANALFESAWNRDRVERVVITVAEELGVEQRAGYYEEAGAVRDIVQNHLTQLLALVAMEVPTTFRADAIRAEKLKVLQSIAPIQPGDVVLGQYASGTVGEAAVPGYREEPGVDRGSRTETFAAVRLAIDNWRWQGVPFYLRTGKRLARRMTEIAVTFRHPPVHMFSAMNGAMNARGVPDSTLVLRLQPDEGFALSFGVKVPGPTFRVESRPLHFEYAEAFGALPDAYQTLLLDVIQGDQTRFVHADEVEMAWRLYAPLLDGARPEPRSYAAGSWGPADADALLAGTRIQYW